MARTVLTRVKKRSMGSHQFKISTGKASGGVAGEKWARHFVRKITRLDGEKVWKKTR